MWFRVLGAKVFDSLYVTSAMYCNEERSGFVQLVAHKTGVGSDLREQWNKPIVIHKLKRTELNSSMKERIDDLCTVGAVLFVYAS